MRTQQEATETDLTLILDFQPPELQENKCLLLKPPVCGVLLWQPWETTIGMNKQTNERRKDEPMPVHSTPSRPVPVHGGCSIPRPKEAGHSGARL